MEVKEILKHACVDLYILYHTIFIINLLGLSDMFNTYLRNYLRLT